MAGLYTNAGLYAIGLVLAPPALSEEARRRLCSVIPTARMHWSQEDDRTRIAMIREVRSLPVEARVYRCRFDRPKRKEAARARALAWLVQELPYQVRSVVLAEREANQEPRPGLTAAGSRTCSGSRSPEILPRRQDIGER
ncbi:hypothetical protein GCM10027161_78390 [Microbispora hainanensis]